MLSLTEHDIRASFINASRKEVSDLALPTGFDSLDWSKLDFLGWRDPKRPQRGYLVVPSGIGVMLRQSDVAPRTRAMCSLCQDVTLSNDVMFFSAKRGGEAGRRGDTIGALICSDFQCSANARRYPPSAYLGYDIAAAREAQIARLQERVTAFAEEVRG